MDFVRLGRSDLTVSRIAFGTWQLSGAWGGLDARAATAAVNQARDLGVNFFDTAQAYGFGSGEQLLGQALRSAIRNDRDSIVIATKGGVRDDNGRFIRDADPRLLRDGLEASLTALGVDYVDLFQVHWPDPRRPSEETAEVLREMVAEGKVRHVGVSNFSVAEIADLRRSGLTVGTLQPPYNLLNRAAEPEILPYCRENDIGVLIYGPLAHGLLSGAFDERSVFGADDWRSNSPIFQGPDFHQNIAFVDNLKAFARARGHTVSQIAIAWTLANPAVQSAIVGARRADHISEAAGAVNVQLTESDLAGIDHLLAASVPVGQPMPDG